MKLKTTKILANEINKRTNKFKVYQKQLTIEQFERLVNAHSLENENDFNWETGKFNVFMIEYAPEYYAVNDYATTNDLIKIYKRSNKTLESFITEFENEFEI